VSFSNEQLVSGWRLLAFTLYKTWIAVLFYSTALFTRIDGKLNGVLADHVYIWSIVFLTFFLASAGVFHRKAQSLLNHRAGQVIGPVAMSAGTLLLFPDLIAGTAFPPALLIASGLLTGLGSAILILYIGRAYAVSTLRESIVETIASAFIAALIALCLFYLPIPFGLVTVLACSFCPFLCLKNLEELKQSGSIEPRTKGEDISNKMLTKLVVGCIVIAVCLSLIRVIYPLLGYTAADKSTPRIVICNIVATLILVVPLLLSKESRLAALYKFVMVFIIVGFAILPCMRFESPLPYVIVMLSLVPFDSFAWIIMICVAQRYQYTTIQVFGLGKSLWLLLGSLAGPQIIPRLFASTPVSPHIAIIISATVIILLTLTRNYILTCSDLALFSKPIVDREVQVHHDTPEEAETKVIEAPTAKQLDDYTHSLQVRCRIIGDHYGLSPREKEVFTLLASGRSAARIQEELMISEGTVNTHCRHVYQKLGVHTQQELIDLMQNADLAAML